MALGSKELDEELFGFMDRRLRNRPLNRFKMPSEETSPSLIQADKARDRDYIAEALQANDAALGQQSAELTLPGQTQGIPTGLALSLSNLKRDSGVDVDFSNTAGSQVLKPNGANGRLKPKQLVGVGNGHKLQPAAARAFKVMRRDAAKDGVRITLTDSYRDLSTQERLAKEKGLYSQGGLAAKPGTSNHGWGLAVDVDEGREWLAKNGNRYGFKTIPREPWHWEYEN